VRTSPLVKIKPLDERRRNRPVGIVVDAYKSRGVYFATQERLAWIDADRLRAFDGIVYMLCRPSRLLAATDARQWTGYSWNGGINKLVQDGGATFYPMATAVKNDRSDTEGTIDALYELFSWLMQRAIVPGSLSSMTWRLWRATLDKPVTLSRRRLLGARALYGGRQEAPYPGDYVGCKYFDITAAYPTAMADTPYPTELRDAGKHLGEGAGIAQATVTIPKMEWSPIPVRLSRNALCYGYGIADGFWPWSDLRLARDVGCKVEIHESWQGVTDVDLFGEWWDVVREGRAQVALSKAVTSRLWGAFSLSQKTGNLIRWSDAAGRIPIKAPMSQRTSAIPTAPYIAAETTARVRDRLYRQGILGVSDVLYVDTDAVINGGSVTPTNFGPAPGQWRMKASMVRCEIRGPQVFRHECPTCDRDHSRWHYVVSGAPSTDHAIRAFERTKRHKGQSLTAFTPGQITLPAGPLERYMA
jgi:hypothetical protein